MESSAVQNSPTTVSRNGSAALDVENLSKSYPTAHGSLTVLSGINLRVAPGESCAIIGPSGSGKTTLLGLCAGLDEPTTGTVRLAGETLAALSEDGRAALRSRHVGFVFQSFHLIPTLTAIENVLVPLELQGLTGGGPEAEELLAKVGLRDRVDHYPAQLSGGEQQRVALARAFVHRPAILFADEPTGNLDAETSAPIVDMLFELNRNSRTALILVTHDPTLAARAGRVVKMQGGRIVADSQVP